MRAIEKLIDSGVPILCGIMLILMVMFIFLQIVVREFFNISLNWSDEGAQFCMMWMVLLGSIYLTKHGQHINTGIKVHRKLNKRLKALIDASLALVTVGSAAVIAYQSFIFAFSGYKAVSLHWFNMVYIYIAVPIFMLALDYYYLKSFFENLALVFKKIQKT
jgi:TRAP-type C4-dicarboxylate transport system permease small subunit